jgi:transketolase
MTANPSGLDELCVNTIRALAIDTVQKANSGHPGLPLGAAPVGYSLFAHTLRHNPRNPQWPDRDRFVLSAGHGSALLYSLLHLTGYDLPLEQLKQFRQFGSQTPGHPERGDTAGVETTTGPLGQGFGNAVGMALAERHLAATFNRPGHEIVDHRTFVLAGDGDLMEGVAQEAASLAGHLGLGKLVCFYDSNHICLASTTKLVFTTDVAKLFEGYEWHVQTVADGNDLDAIAQATARALAVADRPSLVIVRSEIGYGSPKQGTFGVHGSPLDAAQVVETKRKLGYPSEEPFFLPGEAVAHLREAVDRGRAAEASWRSRFEAYRKAHPEAAAELERRLAGELPKGWDQDIPTFTTEKPIATRAAGGKVINAIAARVPELVGGSADLNPSTDTALKGLGDFQNPARPVADRQGAVGGEWGYAGRNLHFGVREHAMAAISNGTALHGGIIPFCATFFTFADYMRPSIRLASIMQAHTIFVFTHDSIGVGEDGPTHEPVEQAASLRAMPKLVVIRPADANETASAWRVAMQRQGPVALLLTRQAVPVLAGTDDVIYGGYVLADAEGGPPDVILIGTGSEVSVAVEARTLLAGRGVKARVVSLPSWELFEAQPQEYRDSVLPPSVLARVAVEAGVPMGWERYVGPLGKVVGVAGRYGASAPVKVVMEKYGFTAQNVADRAIEVREAVAARLTAMGLRRA